MPDLTPSELLATIVRRTMQIHEDSYVPPAQFGGLPSGVYSTPLRQAASLAAEELGHPQLEMPVYLMLYSYWNDADDWVVEILGREAADV